MAVNDAPSPPPGVIRYRQLWVSDDGVTHLAERRFGGLETMDFTSTGGDAAMQYVRAFSSTDESGAQGGPCNQLVLGVAPKVFPAAGPGA